MREREGAKTAERLVQHDRDVHDFPDMIEIPSRPCLMVSGRSRHHQHQVGRSVFDVTGDGSTFDINLREALVG